MNFDFWRHYWRGRFYMLFSIHAPAAQSMELANQAEPGRPRVASCLGYCYGNLGRDELAEEYFREALRLDPDNPVTLFDLGFILDRRRKHGEAAEAFEKAVERRPALDRAWYGLGLARAALGRHDLAAKAMERAAELQPMNPAAWYNLGMAYHLLGEREKLNATIAHLNRFDPKQAHRLATETGETGWNAES